MSVELVMSAISDILHLSELSLEDNFMDLGGSSLAAVQLVARLDRETGVRVNPKEVLSVKTLSELANLLASKGREAGTKAGAAQAEATTSRQRARASMAQQWALDAERLEPDAPPLQFQAAYTVTGPLDVSSLQAAVRAVAAHHPALQVRLSRRTGHYEMVHTTTSPMIVVEEGATTEDARRARLTQFARRRFPADTESRLRVIILRAAPDQHDICLAFDHRVADGWSLGVVLEDLSTAYGQRTDGRPVELPPAGSYLDYAEAEWSNAEERVRRATDYWSGILPRNYADFPLALPGRLVGARLERPRMLYKPVPDAAVAGIRQMARASGQGPLAVAMAALVRVISAATGADEVRILTSAANRGQASHHRTVGWFANGVFPTFQVAAYQNDVDLVRHIAQRLVQAAEVGDVPASYVRTVLWRDAPSGFRKDTGIYLACNESWSEPLALVGCKVTPINIEDRADAPGIQFFLVHERSNWALYTYFHAAEYPEGVVSDLIDRFLARLVGEGSTSSQEIS